MKMLPAIFLAAPLFAQAPAGPAPAKPLTTRPTAAASRTPAAPTAPSDLKYPPLRPITAPKIEAFQLSNGMRILLMEDRELPIVTGSAMVRTGGRFDPPDRTGLAALAGTVMRSGGYKSRPGEQLDAFLESRGAKLECSIGDQSAAIHFTALKESAPAVMEAVRDLLAAPEFPQDKIDQAKAQTRNAVARRNDDLGAVTQRELTRILYGRATPYSRQIEHSTLSRIARGDLQAFQRRYFFPANVRLALRGDFDPAQIKTELETVFGAWKSEQPTVPSVPQVADAHVPGIYLAEKKVAPRAYFAIGHLAGDLRDKDYPALYLAGAILGNGSRSRLAQRLGRRPGVNEISASWNAEFDSPGIFRIAGELRSGDTDTLKAVLHEVEQFRAAGVTEDELKIARETVLQNLLFTFDTKEKVLNRVLACDNFGYPLDCLEQFQQSLAAVTKAAIDRVIRERIDPSKFVIVAAGGPSDFAGIESLEKPVIKLDLTIPDAKVEITRQDETSLEKGKRLLARAQEAVGGAAKLLAVKDTTVVAEFQVAPAAGGMQVTETDRWLQPSYFRQESQIPKQGKIAAYFDGKAGAIGTPNGSGALTGAQLKQVKGDLFRLYIPLLLSDRITGRIVNAVDDNTIEISEPGGEAVKLVLDPGSGMPARLLYDTVPAAGPLISVEDTYSDFREVAGIRVPFAYTILQGGRKFADVKVTEIKVNTGLKVEDLKKLQ